MSWKKPSGGNFKGGTLSESLTLNANPTAPLQAATKQYVDNLAQGIEAKLSVKVATTGNITLDNTTPAIDGVNLVNGDRILVKNQTNATTNGVYVFNDSGSWSRSDDTDTSAELENGCYFFVEQGTDNGQTGWVLISDIPIVLGTSNLTFTIFNGEGSVSVKSVTGVSPIQVTNNTANPQISISNATTTTAGAMSSLDKTKLNSIQSGATVNSTDAQLRDRATHTGTQPINSVSGLQSALDGKANINHLHSISDTTGLQTVLDNKQNTLGFTPENSANKGQNNGYAGLDSSGKVPRNQIPSDVIEVADVSSLPVSGIQNAIYVTVNTNRLYRWNGISYTQLTSASGGGGGSGASDTDGLPEGILNKYFTETRTRGTVLTGLDTTTNSAISATDNILQAQGKLQAQINNKANTNHIHNISDTTGLQTALDSKASTSHSHSISDVVNLQSSLDSKASTTHSHSIGDTTGLQSALDGKASLSHSHTISDVTNLQSSLDAKANSSHNHSIADTTGLQTALDNKANVSHSHSINDVNGLQTALDGKASSSHSHSISDVTNLQTVLDNKQASLGFTPENVANKGQANGYASLDNAGKVPAAQLPSYVDDVLEVSAFANLPTTGEISKIYLTLDNNKIYRWSGTAYIEIVASPSSTDSVIEGVTNLYFNENRVRNTALTGLSTSSNTAITATDSIISGIGKLQAQINNGVGSGAHTHAISDINGLQTALDSKSNTGHSHSIADTTGLQTALDGKASTSHNHAINDVTGLQTALDNKANSTHNHTISDTTGLQTALDGKANASHNHTITDVTNLQTVLDSKSNSDHTHSVATTTANGFMASADKVKLDGIASGSTANATDVQLRDRSTHTGTQSISTVDGLQLTLDGKANTNHSHSIGDVTNLQSSLDSKASTSHNHTISDTTGLQTALDNKSNTNHTHSDATTTISGFMSSVDKTKLDGIANGATVNSSDVQLRDRSTHTGTQSISTISGLQSSLDSKANSPHTHAIADVTNLQTSLDSKQNSLGFTPENIANKGVTNGYASLDSSGKVPASQLPSFVDDVLEFANLVTLPTIGETGKIYVTLDNNKTFRWSGTAYIEISASPSSTDSITEGTSNLYFTETRVRNTALTGLSTSTNSAVTATDNVLGGLGKLQAQVNSKSNTGHTHTISDVTNLQSSLDGKANTSHTHTIADVTNLQTSLDGKANTSHTHTIANVTGLQTALDGKSDTAHTHSNATTSVSGFMSSADKTKLDGIATNATANATDSQLRDRSTHTGTQAISTVTGLQTALDSKAGAGHSHYVANEINKLGNIFGTDGYFKVGFNSATPDSNFNFASLYTDPSQQHSKDANFTRFTNFKIENGEWTYTSTSGSAVPSFLGGRGYLQSGANLLNSIVLGQNKFYVFAIDVKSSANQTLQLSIERMTNNAWHQFNNASWVSNRTNISSTPQYKSFGIRYANGAALCTEVMLSHVSGIPIGQTITTTKWRLYEVTEAEYNALANLTAEEIGGMFSYTEPAQPIYPKNLVKGETERQSSYFNQGIKRDILPRRISEWTAETLGADGSVSSSTNRALSRFVPVREGQRLVISPEIFVAMYTTDTNASIRNLNTTLDKAEWSSTVQTVVVPSGITYVRFGARQNSADANFTDFTATMTERLVGNFYFAYVEGEKENILPENVSDWEIGSVFPDGTFTAVVKSRAITKNFIPVNTGQQLLVSRNIFITMYTSDNNLAMRNYTTTTDFLGWSTTSTRLLTIPNNVTHIKITILRSDATSSVSSEAPDFSTTPATFEAQIKAAVHNNYFITVEGVYSFRANRTYNTGKSDFTLNVGNNRYTEKAYQVIDVKPSTTYTFQAQGKNVSAYLTDREYLAYTKPIYANTSRNLIKGEAQRNSNLFNQVQGTTVARNHQFVNGRLRINSNAAWGLNHQEIDVKPSTTYTLSFQGHNVSAYLSSVPATANTNTVSPFWRLDTLISLSSITAEQLATIRQSTYTTGSTQTKVYLSFTNAQNAGTLPPEIFNIQLEEGSVATPYQPYNSNDIEENILPLNETEYVQGAIDSNTDRLGSEITRISTTNFVTILPSERLTVSAETSLIFYRNGVILPSNSNLIGFLNREQIVVVPDAANQFKAVIRRSAANETITTTQLASRPYYVQREIQNNAVLTYPNVPLLNTSRNLIKGEAQRNAVMFNQVNRTHNSRFFDGKLRIVTNELPLSRQVVTVKPNTRYTFSAKGHYAGVRFNQNEGQRMFWYNGDIISGWTLNGGAIITGATQTSLIVEFLLLVDIGQGIPINPTFNSTTGLGVGELWDIQLEEGSVATAYEPYNGTDIETNIFPTNSTDWEQGGISHTNGALETVTYYIRSKNFISVIGGETLKLSAHTAVIFYRDGAVIDSTQSLQGFFDSPRIISVPTNANQIRLVVRDKDVFANPPAVAISESQISLKEYYLYREVVNPTTQLPNSYRNLTFTTTPAQEKVYLSFNGDGEIWGMQLEEGTQATYRVKHDSASVSDKVKRQSKVNLIPPIIDSGNGVADGAEQGTEGTYRVLSGRQRIISHPLTASAGTRFIAISTNARANFRNYDLGLKPNSSYLVAIDIEAANATARLEIYNSTTQSIVSTQDRSTNGTLFTFITTFNTVHDYNLNVYNRSGAIHGHVDAFNMRMYELSETEYLEATDFTSDQINEFYPYVESAETVITSNRKFNGRVNIGTSKTFLNWSNSYIPVQINNTSVVAGRAGSFNNLELTSNLYRDNDFDWRRIVAGTGARLLIDGSTPSFVFSTVTNGATGVNVTPTTRFSIGTNEISTQGHAEEWNSDYIAVKIGWNAVIAGRVGNTDSLDILTNMYRASDGNWKHIRTGGAAKFTIDSTGLYYLSVNSGSAGSNAVQTERLRISATTGNVGIGTNSPLDALHVHRGTGSSYFRLSGGNDSTSERRIIFDASASISAVGLFGQSAGGAKHTLHINQDLYSHSNGNITIGSSTAQNERLAVNGAVSATGYVQSTVTVTSAHTATATNYVIRANAATAAFTITLPAAATNTGRIYVIKKVDSTANIVTIDANASETIDGSLTTTLTTQYQRITIQSNGTGWDMIG